ncbi:hypothetical protein PG995_009360 [Apiospora arundinis]
MGSGEATTSKNGSSKKGSQSGSKKHPSKKGSGKDSSGSSKKDGSGGGHQEASGLCPPDFFSFNDPGPDFSCR